MSASARIVVERALPALRAALHPLDTVPTEAPWNIEELFDLLPASRVLTPAAVLAALVPRADGLQVLLTVRTESLRHHGGQVSFPGGRIEDGDAGPVAAALREACEETGIAVEAMTPLGFLDPLATVSGFCVLPVVAALDPGYAAFPHAGEVAEVFEAPLDVLLDPTQLHSVTLDYQGRPRTVYEYRREGPRIWGATASMLLNLRHRLELAHARMDHAG